MRKGMLAMGPCLDSRDMNILELFQKQWTWCWKNLTNELTKTMRYTVRYYNGKDIVNDLSTNELYIAIKRELELKKQNPQYKIWVCDSLMELLVG